MICTEGLPLKRKLSNEQPPVHRALLLLTIAPLCVLTGCRPAERIPDISQQSARIASVKGVDAVEFHHAGELVNVNARTWDGHLTLDTTVARVMRHSPTIQATGAKVRAALADAKQARLLPNPVVSVALRFPEGGGKPTIEAGLTAELLSLLSRPGRIDIADARLRASASDVLSVVIDEITEVQTRYAEAQAIDARLKVLADQQRAITRVLGMTQSRVEAGEAPRLDVLAIDAQRLGIETDLLDAEARRRDVRLDLARLIGRPSDPTANDWTLETWEAPSIVNLSDEKRWITTAMNHRPDIQSRTWELAARGVDVKQARWGVLDGAEVGADAEREDGNWGIGPAIATPLPLFDWGQAKRQKAMAEQSEARHALVAAQRLAVTDVRQAIASVAASQQSLEKQRTELLPLLKRRHEQAIDAYQAGSASMTDVLLAEQELQSANGRLIELQEQLSSAMFRLQRAAGGRDLQTIYNETSEAK